MAGPPKVSNENISNLLATEEQYAAPKVVAEKALQQDFEREYQRSVEDPAGFWGDIAHRFQWSRKWDQALVWQGARHQWFVGGKLNITVNALDRHAFSERRNKLAYIWLGEDGSERMVTYGQLHRRVCQFANGLKSLGIGKGDRVIIYMPLTLEGVISMLACARIGAIHSVVYAGLGATSLRDRIEDAQAKLVIAGDVGYRRGKPVALKAIVDEALQGASSVQKIVILARQSPFHAAGPKEIDFNSLFNFPTDCPAEEMDAEDPLFILYTSGTTGKPKGVVHVHGGYMVGTTYHLATFSMSGSKTYSGVPPTSGGS